MGYGRWTRADFERYSYSVGRAVTKEGHLDSKLTDQQLFTKRTLDPKLDPKNVIREACDSDDHPATVPVILALDVTGSMGAASAEVAKKMNAVMTELYTKEPDVQFMIMGIGDLAYDKAPIQISQFESDIRIAEQLDLVYMEHGGGGNAFESYTAAWYMGLYHTKLDCLKRGKKALIITMGDEPMNPYLPYEPLAKATGDDLQADVETKDLYRNACEKFEIFHLHVNHTQNDRFWPTVQETFGKQLETGHLERVTVDTIAQTLIRIVTEHAQAQKATGAAIRWETAVTETPPEAPATREITWDTDAPVAPACTRREEPVKRKALFNVFHW